MAATSAANFYSIHSTKADYKKAFDKAQRWALESEYHRPIDAARIYHVKEESLKTSVRRIKQRVRNTKGIYNNWGGNNKVLDTAQEEAIQQYCYEQWEIGLGATHEMLRAAITYLKQVFSRILDVFIILIPSIYSLNLLLQILLPRPGLPSGYGKTRRFTRSKQNQLHIPGLSLTLKRMLKTGSNFIMIPFKNTRSHLANKC